MNFKPGELEISAGDIVALTQCVVYVSTDDSQPTAFTMSGLFYLDEFQASEPSAYNWEDSWSLFPFGEVSIDGEEPARISDREGLYLYASADRLFEQIDPQGYGHMLAMEREMEFWQEDEARLYDMTDPR